jgi:predicted Zn-dependent protease with MMP-like domain
MNGHWNRLQTLAQLEVESMLAALPAPLHAQAAPLQISYEPRPAAGLLNEGEDPDLLGLFVGPALADPDESPLPPQIILFLENLWEFSDGHEDRFREEIRTTYLHELGHYLGLDELDLEKRGLE